MIWLSDISAVNIKPFKKNYLIWWKDYFFETWKIWLLSDGAITIWDTNWNILFSSVCFKTEWLNYSADFFPLSVEYQEKYYATWTIWWNRFWRREGRPSDLEILNARLIDRPIRPMFPKWIINDTQIIVNIFSSDWEKDIWSWWITASSLWLLIAWTPFEWPVSWIKLIINSNWDFIYDPSIEEEKWARLSLVVAWTLDAITMIEAWWKEIGDEEFILALEYAYKIIKDICIAQEDYFENYKKLFGFKQLKAEYKTSNYSFYSLISEYLSENKLEILYNNWKKEFHDNLTLLHKELKDFLISKNYIIDESKWFSWLNCLNNDIKQITNDELSELIYKRVKELMRKNILKKWKRLDWRKLDEVRNIISEVWLLPRTHWSSLFQRWMTQALTTVTLWWVEDRIVSEWMMPDTSKRYMHHYNFPPYSVWEIKMMRWVWRREIWHWALAERALLAVLPEEEEFPYTIRVVSEIMTCNWSSSMASVCWASMSLMNAWVPIKSIVAWIAMWMIYDEETNEYKILSDIQAQEDFLWDMDFKLARSKKWITAIQLDVKIKWLSLNIFKEILNQWEKSILYIISKMAEVQWEVASSLSKYAPLIISINIPEEKIRTLIWKWWETVQKLEANYNVKISISELGLVSIKSKTQEWALGVINTINEMFWMPEIWYKSEWVITKIIEWTWLIVDFRGKSWLIHISKLSDKKLDKIDSLFKIWDLVKFEILDINKINWKISLKKIL